MKKPAVVSAKKLKSYADLFYALPHPSAFSPRRAWDEAAWNALVARLHRSASPLLFKEALTTLMTALERARVVRRAAALSLFLEGLSYRAIGRELWITPDTVSAIKKAAHKRQYTSRWPRTRKLQEEKLRKAAEKEWERRNAPTGYYRRTKYGRLWTSS